MQCNGLLYIHNTILFQESDTQGKHEIVEGDSLTGISWGMTFQFFPFSGDPVVQLQHRSFSHCTQNGGSPKFTDIWSFRTLR